MRSFSKKLAFVLAAAMVVTSFAPAAKAEAAKEMAINKSSQILYVNEGINHKGADGVAAGKGNVSVYDFSVKNKPADWKDTLSFKWTTSDDEVVAVKAGGVATAVGVGKATITCKVTDKATKETVATLKTKVTVKANAYDVEITNADDVAGLAYEVGATVDLNRAMYDEDGNKTTKRGKLVTDYTRWIAEPSTGVTIDQKTGKFTFAEAGDYTLYCETYQSSKYTKATATSEKVKITVAAGLELKQTTRVKFEVKFGSAVETLNVEDVKVEETVKVAGGTDKVEYLVKGVTLAEDKKSATVEVFYAFNDGASYDVTVKGYDTETFVASNGAPKKIVLHSDEWNTSKRDVLVNNSTKIWATLYDANDIDITTPELRSKLTYIIKYVESDFETSDTTLYFAEAGERAIVTAEYHTYEYDDNSNEKDFFASAPQTFVAVNKATTEVQNIKRYATNGNVYSNVHDIKMIFDDDVNEEIKNQLAVQIKLTDDPDETHLITLKEFGQLIISEDGNEILGATKFTSLTPDIVEVYDAIELDADGNPVLYDGNTNKIAALYPRKVGTGRVMVSYVYTVNGYDVETPIGAVEVKVQGEPTLTYVMVTNKADVCVNPAVNANTQQVEDHFIRVQIAHQYEQWSDNYTGYNSVVLTGNSALAKRAVDEGALEWYNGGVAGEGAGYMKGYVVNPEKFKDILDDMDNNGTDDVRENKSETKACSFSFTVTVTDAKTYAKKSANFTINAKRALDVNNDGTVNEKDMTVKLVTNASSVKNAGNNIARVNTYSNNLNQYSDWSTESAKTAEFVAYYMNNGAYWDEIEIEGKLPTVKATELKGLVASGEIVTNGFYYVVNKGGKNISDAANVKNYTVGDANKNGALDNDGWSDKDEDNDPNNDTPDNGKGWELFGSGTAYSIDFSKDANTKIKNNMTGADLTMPVTSYEQWNADGVNEMGAGNYEFILYQVVYNTNTKTYNAVRKASSALNVTCDLGGNYKLAGRNSVSIDMNDNDTEDGKFQQKLLNCFSIVDREGIGYNSWDVAENNNVKFKNNEVRPFHVNLNAEKAANRADSVFVESITFWEPVEYDWSTGSKGAALRYAEYTVPVGYFVNVLP